MEEFIIKGGRKLSGEVVVHGAKNSALPILAATILCNGKAVLHNCPRLSDVDCAIAILEYMGCKVESEDATITVDASNVNKFDIPDYLMHKMRSSIVFLGAILAKSASAKLTYPGGCEIGPRPIDIHLNALRRLGVQVDERFGSVNCHCPSRLVGTTINLPFPSVGATENIMLAAVTASGVTKIHNAAREPEIADLAAFLNACGGKILGAGGDVITIEGVEKLHGCTHRIIPDRIVATTYMAAAAVTGGDVLLKNVTPEHIEPVFFAFRESGCELDVFEDRLRVKAPKQLSRIKLIRTLVYPGFPTDTQAAVMAMCAVAKGTSIFIETIFQNRYKHAGEMMKLGANIKVEERVAVVEGVNRLYGSLVSSTDLRGGAALVVLGLFADEITRVNQLEHIYRGYQHIDTDLNMLGADITKKG